MQELKAAYLNELIKMRRKSKVVTGAVLSLAAAIIYQLAISLVGNGIGIRIGDGSSFPLSVLGFYSATLLPLFAVFVVIDSFNGETAANTMKQTLVRPLNRLGIFFSKVASIATFVFLNLMFMMVVTTVIGFVAQMGAGFSPIALWRVFVAYLTTWLPVMVFLLLVTIIAQFSHNGILTFFLSIFTYIALFGIRLFYPQFSNLLIVPLFDWYIGWIADVNSMGSLLRQSLILLGSGLALFGLGGRLFETKDY